MSSFWERFLSLSSNFYMKISLFDTVFQKFVSFFLILFKIWTHTYRHTSTEFYLFDLMAMTLDFSEIIRRYMLQVLFLHMENFFFFSSFFFFCVFIFLHSGSVISMTWFNEVSIASLFSVCALSKTTTIGSHILLNWGFTVYRSVIFCNGTADYLLISDPVKNDFFLEVLRFYTSFQETEWRKYYSSSQDCVLTPDNSCLGSATPPTAWLLCNRGSSHCL